MQQNLFLKCGKTLVNVCLMKLIKCSFPFLAIKIKEYYGLNKQCYAHSICTYVLRFSQKEKKLGCAIFHSFLCYELFSNFVINTVTLGKAPPHHHRCKNRKMKVTSGEKKGTCADFQNFPEIKTASLMILST